MLHRTFPVLQVRWSDKTSYALRFWFLHSLSSALFRSFVVYDQYTTMETPFLPIILPPLCKELWISYVFFTIFSSLLQRSSIIKLSSSDLKVSQVSFSIKEKNSIVIDDRLYGYSCIWFELLVFQVLKAVFNSNSKASSLSSFHFWNEIC